MGVEIILPDSGIYTIFYPIIIIKIFLNHQTVRTSSQIVWISYFIACVTI